MEIELYAHWKNISSPQYVEIRDLKQEEAVKKTRNISIQMESRQVEFQ